MTDTVKKMIPFSKDAWKRIEDYSTDLKVKGGAVSSPAGIVERLVLDAISERVVADALFGPKNTVPAGTRAFCQTTPCPNNPDPNAPNPADVLGDLKDRIEDLEGEVKSKDEELEKKQKELDTADEEKEKALEKVEELEEKAADTSDLAELARWCFENGAPLHQVTRMLSPAGFDVVNNVWAGSVPNMPNECFKWQAPRKEAAR